MKRAMIPLCLAVLSSALVSSPALAQWQLTVEAGVFKPERNRVQIPNDGRGDRFNISELGSGAFPVTRLSLDWSLDEKHELQFIYAPFVYTEEGAFNRQLRFDGATFAAGDRVEARYQFSNYRLRYLYQWVEKARWQLDVGATLFVRDASVELTSATTESEDANVGVVPLFAVRATYALSERWAAMLDADLAVAPQGRAIDLALLAQYRISDPVTLSVGYRTIEGGADNDDVYSFAWFNGAVFRAAHSW